MKLLLDTHIWIWSLLEPSKISPRIAKALQDPSNETWLSPISVWEFRVPVEKGRIKLNMGFEEWIAQALTKFSPRETPLATEVVLAMSKNFWAELGKALQIFLNILGRKFDNR